QRRQCPGYPLLREAGLCAGRRGREPFGRADLQDELAAVKRPPETSMAGAIPAMRRCRRSDLLREIVPVQPAGRPCGFEIIRLLALGGVERRAGSEPLLVAAPPSRAGRDRGARLNRRRSLARLALAADRLGGAGAQKLRPHLAEQRVRRI